MHAGTPPRPALARPPARPTRPHPSLLPRGHQPATTRPPHHNPPHSHQTNQQKWDSLTETQRRALASSRPDALSATPSRPEDPTRSDPTSTDSLAERVDRPRASPTPPPTSTRASHGTSPPSSSTSRTPRSTSLARRWRLLASRRRRTATTSSPGSVRRPSDRWTRSLAQ